MKSAVSSDPTHGRSAEERLAQLRSRTLDLLLLVSLLTRTVPLAIYGPGAWSAGNFPFLVVTTLELLTYALLLVFRSLPIRVRAWGFCLVWVAVFAAYLPRGVFAVPLVNAVASAMYAALLLGTRVGIGFTLAILGMLLAAAVLPPSVLAALSYGPPHPPRSDPPMIVATGLIPLLAAPAGIALVLRGLLRSFAESQVNEERLRGILAASPEAMAILEWPAGRHTDVNAAYERLFGWAAAELAGRTLAESGVLRDSDQGLVLGRLAVEPRLSGIELVMRRRDGAQVFGEVGLHRTDVGGRQVVLVILREVSSQRRLESAIRHAQRVEAMGTLAGGIAHNFRNALGSILPNLDYCLTAPPPELREPLEDARSAASAAVDLATRLTQMAQQTTETRREPVEVRTVLASVVGICRSTFGARISIEEAIDLPGFVLADRGELHQVFLNLLLNARDALAEVGAPHIQVRLSRPGDGAHLVVTVADNGHGMDAETLRRVGEPFFTTKPEGKGTGLGLSTAYAAVRDAGGAITVVSRPGEGTTFTVELPLFSRRAAPPEPATPRPLRPDVRVLVVDDDALLLEAVARQLTSLGLQAEPFTDPLAALERLRAGPGCDVLITDLDMPALSGRELAARAHALVPRLPVLILSGTQDPTAVEGAVAVIAKPASTATLADAVGRCLGLGAQPAA